MSRVRVIRWKAADTPDVVKACQKCGFDVECDDLSYPELVKAIRGYPPDAIVIDLNRLPSHGRGTAVALRRSASTRNIPLVFFGGEEDKVKAVRALLPDAGFAGDRNLCARVRAALTKPPAKPVVPADPMKNYAGRSVVQKLGITAGSTVGLIHPPRDYAAALGTLPADVQLIEDPDDLQRITLWFVEDPRMFHAGLRLIGPTACKTKLWIVWRKGLANGLNPNLIREAANGAGLVDYKICAVNQVWSGMAFSPRKTGREIKAPRTSRREIKAPRKS